MPNEKIKHLEFIQDVIARMNQNSFQMKGWMVAIASTLLALYASTKNEAFALVAVFPTLVFWFLDSYYLQQERKFRGLYNDVAGTCEKPQEIKLFAMRPDLYQGGKYSFWNVLVSGSIVSLYLPVIVVLLAIYFIL
ncbi:MAG: hypothetical protein RBS68_14240 [Anaerolineales bacterium]|jgi:hypothetical protein|nr:hypothetical protein [Anaerolineales bacterium]